jgi:hypothetical protein
MNESLTAPMLVLSIVVLSVIDDRNFNLRQRVD